MLYNKTPSKYFNDFVLEQYNTFDNLLFFIDRPETYQTEGRIQTESQSKDIDGTIKNILEDYDICYDEVNCDLAVDYIVRIIKKELNLE